MHFVAAGLSDVGLQRDHNEDSYCILSHHRLFLVADGMGGHRAGDVASRLATHSIAAFFDSGDPIELFPARESSAPALNESRLRPSRRVTEEEHHSPLQSEVQQRLVRGIEVANRRIFDASTRHREVQGMGTTIVAAVLNSDLRTIHFAHVGDSRAYRIRNGKITQITRDHSLINDYLSVMPNLTDEQRSQLPANVITRALGMQGDVAVDSNFDLLCEGDVYLLCSDGLNGMVTDSEILGVAVKHNNDLEYLVRGLIDAANTAGGDDNITVVAIRVPRL